MANNHTPAPWRYEASTKTIRSVPANYWLATMDSWDGAVDADANAAFIVRAVNAHDALVSALKALFENCAMVHKHWGDGDNTKEANAAIDAARAALQLAEGEDAQKEREQLADQVCGNTFRHLRSPEPDPRRYQVIATGNPQFSIGCILSLDQILAADEGTASRRKVEQMKVGDTLAALTFHFTRIPDVAVTEESPVAAMGVASLRETNPE